MARFRFHRRGVAPCETNADVAPRWQRAAERAAAQDATGAASGPGWFDSSWDLIHGLDVCEGPPDDGRSRQRYEAAPRVDALALGDLDFVAVPEATLLDPFGEFGIDGLALV